ncbi:MAG: glycogen synthase GlgA [Actinomycetota bacterium]
MDMLIAMCSTEAVPFAKTGGMADVVGALPAALKKVGQDCVVLMPFYRTIIGKDYDFKLIKKGLNVPMNDTDEEFYDLLEAESGKVTFYFIKNDKFFDRNYIYGSPKGDYRDNPKRFSFFSKAILSALEELELKPDIIHLNDYHCALVPVYLDQIKKERRPEKDYFKNTSTVFTIHNLAYQGVFDPQVLEYCGLGTGYLDINGLEFYGKVNFMKGGILFSDKITTVSPTYAREIMTPEYGERLEGVLGSRKKDLEGIVNGIDYSIWDPESDQGLCTNYNIRNLSGKMDCKENLLKNYFGRGKKETPLIGVISRLSMQKGVDLIAEAVDRIMDLGFFMIILGTGDEKYQKLLKQQQRKHKGSLSVNITYSEKIARFIYSGCDMFLMPSKYEPCGLGQLISLKYGTVPVARDTGGLSDTISNIGGEKDIDSGATGFKFREYDSARMVEALKRALSYYRNGRLWNRIIKNGMSCDFSWKSSAESYKKLYLSLKK